MSGIFNYAINLEFVSEDKSKLLENIYRELDEETYECTILRKVLLTPELENGQIIFSGINLQDWDYQCDEELVNKVMDISKKYNGLFVGKFKWWFNEHNLLKHITFYDNGKISTEYPYE
jgi:hypothetical protein